MDARSFSVLLSADPHGYASQVAAHLAEQPQTYARVESAPTLLELERRLSEQPPDLVTVDLALPGLTGPPDAGRLVRWYRKLVSDRGLAPRRVVVISPLGDDELVAEAWRWGADYFVVRPFDVPTLSRRLRQLLTGERPAVGLHRARRRREIELRVVSYLEALGMPPHYKGRAYLKDAIVMVVERRDLLDRVTKELYPCLAAMHRTSPAKVERAMRHAIESTVQRGHLELIEQLFASLMDERRTRPTNSSFIARLADQIRLDMEMGPNL